MVVLRIDDRVIFDERTFRVRGISPMGVLPRRALLEDVETGAQVEVSLDAVLAQTQRSTDEASPSKR